jgi:glycosyltransferase involved in cell wall biosynthesis
MISVVIISKDEPALADTLVAVCAQAGSLDQKAEVLVIDASDGRLDHIRGEYEDQISWIKYTRPHGVRISIPHQRNAGVQAASGEIIVFTDAGCVPEPGWLDGIVAPLLEGESMTHGLTLGAVGGMKLHDRLAAEKVQSRYLSECSTINTAFRRVVYEEVEGFDEGFAYGSDVDFSWRVVASGYRIRSAPDAAVRHDWGTSKRQVRRAYLYGKARARLYRKHPGRLRGALREDPIFVIYPLFLLGLPLTFFFPFYPALLLIPAWRNRKDGSARVILDHLIFGAGVLVESVRGQRIS